ncbi:LPXTG cell wall anchor domain-containing protein [Streptomyces sp. ISL-66]|uniref:LPXTG cell wall anchor domain-containing protein n=1 Tax=Streptomyces sp. ISL-66 TaxID=2819186 RepID=UPI001BE6F43E|nr:LPXTG cell wall anchor domain-containing protein [Streptomyces sp. ISL-66]MBT2472000.1 LPXTG cell wall anchor domain-containing protein [Streptomyces sp. ISL-66]
MSARRSALTALGATTLLAALWFVPSANATAPGHASGTHAAPAAAIAQVEVRSAAAAATVPTAEDSPLLADTGGIDTTPYLLAGTLCLGLGAGFVTFSVRRSRAV